MPNRTRSPRISMTVIVMSSHTTIDSNFFRDKTNIRKPNFPRARCCKNESLRNSSPSWRSPATRSPASLRLPRPLPVASCAQPSTRNLLNEKSGEDANCHRLHCRRSALHHRLRATRRPPCLQARGILAHRG